MRFSVEDHQPYCNVIQKWSCGWGQFCWAVCSVDDDATTISSTDADTGATVAVVSAVPVNAATATASVPTINAGSDYCDGSTC
jgi:hypothetical protein